MTASNFPLWFLRVNLRVHKVHRDIPALCHFPCNHCLKCCHRSKYKREHGQVGVTLMNEDKGDVDTDFQSKLIQVRVKWSKIYEIINQLMK